MQTKNNSKYWDKAWSLVDGCTPVSPACDNCWLATIDYRFSKCHHACADCSNINNCSMLTRKNFSTGNIEFKGLVKARPERLDIPLKTKKPTIFAIWSDLFHEQVSDEFIDEAFIRMESTSRHTFLVCTKRPERMSIFFKKTGLVIAQENIYLGTTCENQEMADERIPELLKCKPFKLFLSVEPMLSFITIPQEQLKQISYVIAGCESGRRKRETRFVWIMELREQCIQAGVPFFLKQPVELQDLSKAWGLLTTVSVKKEDLWK